MCKIKINDEILFAEKGELLSDILIRNGKSVEHPCGGKGTCRKCKVYVDGREELSCQYRVNTDVSVSFFLQSEIVSETGTEIKDENTENACFCLDLGTTTLALALVSLDTGNVLKVETATNPQRIFGADIMTRIDYCIKNGVEELKIYVPTNQGYVNYNVVHSVIPNIRCDTWRLSAAYFCDDGLSVIRPLTKQGAEWEMALNT